MHPEDINLTAYNSETEGDRITRLHRVVGYICALADHYANEFLFSKIVKLHDHKGELTVESKTSLSEGEKEIIIKAWGSSIGDGADNVVFKSV